jgi:cytochrome c oxidase subunit 2
MVVPVNTKVKLLITADDVVHSWWVPEFGIKQDAIPGYINENWIYITKPGTYRGQCGELCGVNHGFMPIVVQAMSQEDYNKWIIAQQKKTTQTESLAPMTKAELLAMGKANYEKSCAMCHQSNGMGLPPTFPPLKGSRIVTGPAAGADAFVLTGVPGTSMQAFGEQMDNRTLAAIITYIRQAWGNDAIVEKNQYQITVQPQDVANARSKK